MPPQPEPLISPAALAEELPIGPAAAGTVACSRAQLRAILDGADDRLVVLVGPCSVHDPRAAIDYATRLAPLADQLGDRLHLIMRAYLEKPRTALGWPGLLTDPHLDGRGDLPYGLRAGRSLLLRIVGTGLPVGCEFLDPNLAGYLADAVSWGCLGARTAHSQVHRQLASALPMPVGVKNPVDGDPQAAVDAVLAAARPHVRTGIAPDGRLSVQRTAGNPDGHLVLRGSRTGPNHHPAAVWAALTRLVRAGLPPRLLIDASHGNSGRDHRRQAEVVRELAVRIGRGEPGIAGVMMESFLVAGRQPPRLGRRDELRYGQSVTDACLDWPGTVELLHRLADAVTERRSGGYGGYGGANTADFPGLAPAAAPNGGIPHGG